MADNTDTGAGAVGEHVEEELTLLDKLQSAPELRLIGRRIRLHLDDHAYQGLVSYVSKQTVVLIGCERLTFEQEALRVAFDDVEHRRHEKARERNKRERRLRRKAQQQQQQQRRAAAADTGGSRAPGDEGGAQPAGPEPQAAASSEEVLNGSDVTGVTVEGGSDDDGPDETADPTIAEQLKENEGEYPFCTFMRRRIRDVRLMDNVDAPPKSEKPPDHVLRAHIRRYVIHSTLGNTQTVTLMTFVRKRVGWRRPDEDVVEKIQAEEYATVCQLADEVSAERLAALRRAGADDAGLGIMRIGARRNNTDPHGNAPFGEDDDDLADEDALRLPFYAVGLHSKTMYASVLHLVLSMVVLLYAASVFSSAESAVVSPFIGSFSSWVAGAATAQLVQSAVVGIHSMRMRLPVPCKLMTVRVIVWLVGVGVLSPTIYVTSSSAYTYENPLKRSAEEIYLAQVRDNPQVICSFASANNCGGWGEACPASDSPNWDRQRCPVSCTAVVESRASGCQPKFEADIRNVVVPVAVFQYLAGIVYLADLRLLVLFFLVANDPEGTLARARRRRGSNDAGASDDD